MLDLPRCRFDSKHIEFEGIVPLLTIDDRVHAVCIRLQRVASARFKVVDRTCGKLRQAQRPKEPVNRKRLFTKNFRKSSLPGAPDKLHLPETILCLDHTSGEVGIMIRAGDNVGHTEGIAINAHLLLEAVQGKGARGGRKRFRRKKIAEEEKRCRDNEEGKANANKDSGSPSHTKSPFRENSKRTQCKESWGVIQQLIRTETRWSH